MDRCAEVDTLIDKRRDEMIARYPEVWKNIIAGWNASDSDDLGWLMYSANYLFRTHNVRWAIDPLTLNSRVPGATGVDITHDLKNLDFVLLTHRHGDHLDIDLLRALRHLSIQWVVPEAILPIVRDDSGIPIQQILIPKPAQPIELLGLRIIPFKGLHYEKSAHGATLKDVPTTAYLVECDGKRWLFPGDTRNYDPVSMPDFGEVDVLFAHLWLGNGMALHPHPPLLNEFCNFCLSFHPHRIILTHLEEWGRRAPDFWGLERAGQVVSILCKQAPNVPIKVACTGDEILLN